jgi:hypothetical protein
MPLVTYADLLAPSASDPSVPVYRRVAARIHDSSAPMPPPPSAALSAPDLSALDAFLGGGEPRPAPLGEACTVDAGDPGEKPAACKADLSLAPRGPIEIPSEVDTVVCYGVDLSVSGKRHLVGLLPRIDAITLVHHITLFVSDTPVPADPAPCGPNGADGWRLLTVWTPGADGMILPEEAGFPVEGDVHYAVQVHYENLDRRIGVLDTSGFDLCSTSKLRPNDAGVLVFGTTAMTIPAHGSLDLSCDYQIPPEMDGRTMFAALPHMHRLGKRIGTSLSRAVGEPIADLGTRDPWTYATQYWSPVQATMGTGDRVTTRCAWDNPGSAPVGFGETAVDEMCWSFTMYYPEVKGPAGTALRPALDAKCAPSP